MSEARQQTIGADTAFEGVGLHTGETTHLHFRPAAPDHGIRFRRVDLEGAPEVSACLDRVTSTERGTTLGEEPARVHTVEHLLAAASALRLDNLLVELDGPEVPIGDGSFRPFFDRLRDAGVEAQQQPARFIDLQETLSVSGPAGASYVAVAAPALRLSTTIEFDHPLIRRQFASFEVDPEHFATELAPARTFGFLHEAEQLRSRGLAQGATLDNALVLDDEGLAGGELRFPDEFVRHKMGDIVGDLALLGRRVRAHVVADRPSHAGNLALARELEASEKRQRREGIVDIQKIMQYLPHRYPMLLVDRIIEFEPGKRIVGIKNVTINEPFFQGHYVITRGHPVMPGVLVIEAMAQVGGLLLLDAVEKPEEQVIYFMSLDNVKWRRPVTPGDQIRFELEVLQLRTHVARMRGVGTVDGKVVAEAEMMARIVNG